MGPGGACAAFSPAACRGRRRLSAAPSLQVRKGKTGVPGRVRVRGRRPAPEVPAWPPRPWHPRAPALPACARQVRARPLRPLPQVLSGPEAPSHQWGSGASVWGRLRDAAAGALHRGCSLLPGPERKEDFDIRAGPSPTGNWGAASAPGLTPSLRGWGGPPHPVRCTHTGLASLLAKCLVGCESLGRGPGSAEPPPVLGGL